MTSAFCRAICCTMPRLTVCMFLRVFYLVIAGSFMLPVTAFSQQQGNYEDLPPSNLAITGHSSGNMSYGNEPATGMDSDMTSARALVATRNRAVLSAEISARIADMPKRPGDRFAKGDVLVVFDCSAYRAQRAAVAADLRQADAQYKAQKRLAELRTVGALDVVMAQAAMESAKAQLKLQDVYLSRCKITAPYEGAVVDWQSQPYQTATPGDQLIDIVGSGDLELELIVPSHWLAWLKVGQGVSAHIDETDRDVRAKVTRIGARIDPVSQTVKIYAALDDVTKGLLPGMSGRAQMDDRPDH